MEMMLFEKWMSKFINIYMNKKWRLFSKMLKLDSNKIAKLARIDAVNMVHSANASHIGAVLSCIDILSVLYSCILNIDPKNTKEKDRDKFILSKGHAGVGLYAVLAECGFFSRDLLKTYYQNNSLLSGHVSHKGVNGVELSTGSLGHGIAVASGIALGDKIDCLKAQTYVLVGDGELNEGSVWETIMFAAQMKLNNFTVIVDRNNLQAMGYCRDIIDLDPLEEKFKAFDWDVESINGNDHDELLQAFTKERTCQPRVIIAKTVKGFGVSFMENKLEWHYKSPQGNDYNQAINELEQGM